MNELQEELFNLVNKLSEVRLYNSCNVFKGPMVRDVKLVYELVMEARKLIEKFKTVVEE